MPSKGAVLSLDLGPHWLLIWSLYLLHGVPLALKLGLQLVPGAPMAVSKGIALALDSGTPSCSRGPLAFDLVPSQGLRHVCVIRGDGDSRGAPRIFLRRARDKTKTLRTPKITFLLGFRPLYFEILKRSKNKKNGEKIKMAKSGSGSPDTFPLTALVGTISEEV